VKGGDDLLQEQLAMAVIRCLQGLFREEEVNCWLRPYEIIINGPCSGLLEFLWDTKSIDGIKRQCCIPLREIFRQQYHMQFEQAQTNFAYSLAGYCVACYVLLLKDRHNGNLLLDKEGHLIHIDFGFILGCSPGGNHAFETAPFKITQEYVDLLDGPESPLFKAFTMLLVRGLKAAAKHAQVLVDLCRVFLENRELPCSSTFSAEQMRARLFWGQSEDEVERGALRLLEESLASQRTGWYDSFQYFSNGIYY
jgi:phosphatidylinositol kinase/protein kinase (PI-3  family)